MGYGISLASPTFRGHRHFLQRASEFPRKVVGNSLGGKLYNLSEMMDHMALSREFCAHFADLSPALVGPSPRGFRCAIFLELSRSRIRASWIVFIVYLALSTQRMAPPK